MKFPFYKQHDATDCGPTCLRMIAKFYGRNIPLQVLRQKCNIARTGVSLLGISDAAESIGLRTLAARLPFDTLVNEVPLPCIAHWKQEHFIIVYKAKKNKVFVADPAHGLLTYTREEFLAGWSVAGDNEGIVLLIETTPDFSSEEEEVTSEKNGLKFILSYLLVYKKFLFQLFLGMLLGSVLALIFPFLTQAIVDVGITNQNIGFVYTVLLAQLMLFASQTSVGFIRSWILLHIGARVNISIISDFLTKMMKLPMPFFDTRTVGDLLQRIDDHRRIENFLTSASLSTVFSIVNLIVFSIVLAIYSPAILIVFVTGTLLAIAWLLLFLKKRSSLDYKRFVKRAENQNKLVQLIQGMPELKLNNSEKIKRWEWEHVQASLFKLNVKSLALSQYQQAGMLFLLKGKDIIVSFLAAKEVIDGNMTLGMMLAVQYIIGQLSGPIDQIINFIHSAQDAKLSSERLAEIHSAEDEEVSPDELSVAAFPDDHTIYINGVSFRYPGPESEKVLSNIIATIPQGKVTAIVGASGSGKTTLMKLLLKFYEPDKGEFRIGHSRLKNINSKLWRGKCGVVMQDGYIFSDTIANNIALGNTDIDAAKLVRAVRVAHLQNFIESLPLSYNTKIGPDGHGLSQGQKQRILIARAVYKNPQFLFFDEATSSLDAYNERVIIENLQEIFNGKTVVVIAHRLSTVKKADQILVLQNGKIVESGTHNELVNSRGAYFNLVKNQLELGT